MIDLHRDPADRRFSSAQAVNASGQVIGFSYPPDGFGVEHAFFWTQEAGAIDLTSGDTVSQAEAVDDEGQVVGLIEAQPLGRDAFRAFLWTSTGGIIDLGTLDSTGSAALDVNARGQVVGYTHSSVGSDHAFLWTRKSGMINLGTLGGSAHAYAVNDNGQVVGDSGTVDDGKFHAVSWTGAGGMIDLGTLGGSESIAVDVNASGQVIGDSYLPVTDPRLSPEYHAVLWQPISSLGCYNTLAGCDLSGVTLTGAYLPGADLRDTNLNGAKLTSANLAGANLRGSNLKGANLARANLIGAKLAEANVRNVLWSGTLCPDGTNSDVNGGTCEGHLRR